MREQVAQRGRAGARKPQTEQRRHDLLIVDLGKPAEPLLDFQPVHQVADDLVGHRADADLVERRLGVQRTDQYLETFSPGVRAEVIGPGALARGVDQLINLDDDLLASRAPSDYAIARGPRVIVTHAASSVKALHASGRPVVGFTAETAL